MPQAIQFTVNDGKSTPQAHVFVPAGPGNVGVQIFENRTPGISSLFEKLKMFCIRATKITPTSVEKCGYSFEIPHSQVVNGLTVVAGVTRFNGSFTFPSFLTPDQRKDARVIAANMMTQALVVSLIDNLDPAY